MSGIALDWQSVFGWSMFVLLTGFVSYLASVVAMRVAKNTGMIAQPGIRQSHQVATPTGGGLGLMFSIVCMLTVAQFFLTLPVFIWLKVFPGILLLIIIGWRDDKHPVSTLVRLLVQLAVSVWLLGFAWFQFSIEDLILFCVAIVSIVWVMNLYNFMDGSNGMAGFQGVFGGVIMAALFYFEGQNALAVVSITVAAACAGFLPLNFPHASVFMGDVASVPLGFIFASLAVYGVHTGALSLPASILIMSVFIVDATLTLLARVIRGEQWYTAHVQHIYQRLIARGWSHSYVLMVYQSINLMLVLPAIVLVVVYPQHANLTAGLALLVLGLCWYFTNRRLSALAKEGQV